MFDVTPLLPEARPVALAATQVYWKHLQASCIGILIHGSALKGGLIPGCSDLDFQLYVQAAALEKNGQLPIEQSMAIQRDLAVIDPAPFQYIQAYVKAPRETLQEGLVGPIPGAYHLIYGRLAVPEATDEQLIQGSKRSIERIPQIIAKLSGDMLEHGGGRLERNLRYLCTDVWPILYSVLTLQSQQALAIWQLPKMSALNLLPLHTPMGSNIRRFYQCLNSYYSRESGIEDALDVFTHGVAFLQAVEQWYAGYVSTNPSIHS
ncbi:hypothetical protein KDA_27810 [Dictyobacter alpinus]|uniref:Adenylyltransferase AadA C-terminal domain-containing protein n=1 Tax=Dictyobacter alpinus TaxID=2014873 RepID=A0A402B7K2_9CHLR|nr:hypothetical protein [Dictyobacter alpinus]GCE27297.1 hypothetical protein KDA_27810 [Dictyobacter alpinus]